MSKRLGIEEGEKLPRSIVEFCLKRDDLGDPLIAEEHIHAFGWASQAEVDEIIGMTLRINDFTCRACLPGSAFASSTSRSNLADMRWMVGHQVLLADEISPDSPAACGISGNQS